MPVKVEDFFFLAIFDALRIIASTFEIPSKKKERDWIQRPFFPFLGVDDINRQIHFPSEQINHLTNNKRDVPTSIVGTVNLFFLSSPFFFVENLRTI